MAHAGTVEDVVAVVNYWKSRKFTQNHKNIRKSPNIKIKFTLKSLKFTILYVKSLKYKENRLSKTLSSQ